MKPRKGSPNLDLLRSVAVLAVLADHLTATHGIAQRHRFLFSLGYWGVLLFFVHTSFVLMMSMERLRLDGWKLYSTFYIRRSFRIYPLSIVTVALAVAFRIPYNSWGAAYHYYGPKVIVADILLCQNLLAVNRSIIGPMWSLPYEIQMYVLLPVLFTILRRSKSLKTLAGIWLAAVAIGLLQPWFGFTQVGVHLRIDRLGIAEYIPCFMAGVTAYYISLRWRESPLPFWVWPLFLVAITAAYLRWQPAADGGAYVQWSCCLAVGFTVTLCRESATSWLNKATHYISKYSYGLYLAQVPVLWLAFVKLNYLPAAAQWGTFLLFIVLVPAVSYHFIEEPLIKFGAGLSTSSALKGSRLPSFADPAS